jgi:hypothetical protein
MLYNTYKKEVRKWRKAEKDILNAKKIFGR